MLSNISPDRADNQRNTQPQRVKPHEPPRNDNFRKTYKEGRLTKEEEEYVSIEGKDDAPPSLFDLSKKNKLSAKSSLTKSSADQSSSDLTTTNRRLPPKQGEGQADSFEGKGTEVETEGENHLNTAEEAFNTDHPQEESGVPQAQLKQAQVSDGVVRQDTLFQQMKSKKGAEGTLDSSNLGQISKKETKSKSEAKAQIAAGQEKSELAGAQSGFQSVNFQIDKAQEDQEIIRSSTIKDLATQIIDRIQVMRKDDLTHTIVTLRHPPILEGATLTLTASDNAKREFNISFANLSPDAKAFLDRKLNENSLTETLERKGIIVHLVTTTTQVENALNLEAGQSFRDRQEQQQEQQQKQQRQNSEEEDIT